MLSSSRIVTMELQRGDWGQIAERRAEYERDHFSVTVRSGQGTNAPFTLTARVTLVFEDRRLLALGLGRRSGRAGDLESLVKVERLVELEDLLTSAEILAEIPTRIRSTVEERLNSTGVFGEVGGETTLEAIRSLRPGLVAAIDDLVSRAASRREPIGPRDVQYREQRDALALGLEIAGIDSNVAEPSDTRRSGNIPYLSALANRVESSEAALIRHDHARFDDWGRIDGEMYDVVEFYDPSNPAKRVSVLYADKEGPERVTGTDLIYFSSRTPGYVLVQYKRMERIDTQPEEAGWLYRPDGQLRLELERMKKLLRASSSSSIPEWRLNAGPFYIKLVQSSLARPNGNKLAPGMYFPLPLFEEILESPEVKGPRGGRAVGWHNAQRYLTNTDFLRLVQGGWIGSQGAQTAEITQAINTSIGIGRGVVAVRDDTLNTNRSQRQRSGLPHR